MNIENALILGGVGFGILFAILYVVSETYENVRSEPLMTILGVMALLYLIGSMAVLSYKSKARASNKGNTERET